MCLLCLQKGSPAAEQESCLIQAKAVRCCIDVFAAHTKALTKCNGGIHLAMDHLNDYDGACFDWTESNVSLLRRAEPYLEFAAADGRMDAPA